MKHEICRECETVRHCSQFGCVPLQGHTPDLLDATPHSAQGAVHSSPAEGEREAFEAAMRQRHRSTARTSGGEYSTEAVELAWSAWQDRAGSTLRADAPWQPIATAPEGEPLLVYMERIDAIDLAHRTEAGRWISSGGTVWPEGVCTGWQPLPPGPPKGPRP